MRPKVMKLMLIAPFAVLGILLFTALGGVVVLLLWNWLLPPLFGLPQLGFWQAIGLLALCRILFAGWGGHGFGSSRVRHRMSERIADRVAERVAERFDQMTPEERERFRQRMGERFGCGPATGESKG